MRLGVFGGTFNPPHLGHLIVAQDACTALALDRLLFVPSATPPHKLGRVAVPADTRLAMTRAATAADARFEVSDIELRRSGPSYTVDTLRDLKERHPAATLFFLLGADQLRELHTWRAPEEVARMATLVVLSRRGSLAPEAEAKVPYLALEVTRIDISATEIRRRCAAGEPIRYLVPPAVEEIITRQALYAPAALRRDAAGAGTGARPTG